MSGRIGFTAIDALKAVISSWVYLSQVALGNPVIAEQQVIIRLIKIRPDSFRQRMNVAVIIIKWLGKVYF